MKSSLSAAEVRAILAARLDILLAECDQVMDNAAFGQTLNDLDDLDTPTFIFLTWPRQSRRNPPCQVLEN